MRQGNRRTTDASVAARFGLKVTLFLVVCTVQMLAFGHPTSFALARVSGTLCAGAVEGRNARWPGVAYRDETAWFGLIAYLS
jgi:hypothetical protein